MARPSRASGADDEPATRKLRDRVQRLERENERLRTSVRRMEENAATLDRVYHAFATPLGTTEMLERIAHAALSATRSDGAYVESIDRAREHVDVSAVAGWGCPPLGTRVPYPGSLSEEVVRKREPEIIEDISNQDRPISESLEQSCGHCSGLIAPLISESQALGALVVLRRRTSSPFSVDDVDRISILSDLAALSLRRVLVLDESDRRRRRAEAAEETLRTTFEALPVGVWLLDASGRIVYGNPAGRRIWGGARFVAPDRFGEYKGWWPETGERIEPLEWAGARAVRDRRTTLGEEVEIEAFDGTRKILRQSALPLIAADGELRGAVVLNEDITARKRDEAARTRAYAEAERRAREEEALRRAVSAVSAAVTVEAVIDAIARSALQATEADAALVERIDEARGEAVIIATAGKRSLPDGFRMPFHGSLAQRVIESDAPVGIGNLRDDPRSPAYLVRACGACSALAVHMVGMEEAIGALVLLRDPGRPAFSADAARRATAFAYLATLAYRRVYLLEVSEARQQELQRVIESRSRLMRGFSHDVKNPLGAADGRLALLEEGTRGGLNEQQHHEVGQARRSIDAALRMITSLIAFARTEAGQVALQRRAVDVRDVAREAADEHDLLARTRGLFLTLKLPDQIHTILSDPDRVLEILGNLLTNAIRYTEEGGVTLRVEEREGGAAPGPGRWIALDIADTGPGIPEDKQELVFREFFRLEPGQGTGLGLAISRRIARLLGGDVTLESEVGKGSTFTLWLPLQRPVDTGEAERRSAGAEAPPTDAPSA